MNTVARAIHVIKRYLNMVVMPLTLQRLEMLRYKPPADQSQTMTTQMLVQMFREVEGIAMTPEETLIICMLNTITDKQLMVKVKENKVKGMDWTEARNVIVKLDRAAHLSDVYHQTNRMHANAAQTKSCRACGKNRHMSALCNITKTKFSCSHCDLKGSHTMNAYLKTKKANKTKEGSKDKKDRGFQERSSSEQRTFKRNLKGKFYFL